jgi:peptidoglycan/LPS O-acetylase OafA/YrhL
MNLMTHSLPYRSDIDGLRALAIVSVILFHVFPATFPAGFIGVDIFFVISGYLITSILLIEAQNKRLSIRNFYARRVRRIFPALALVLLVSLAFAWVMLTPHEYQRLGKHTAGGVGFISNFMFMKEVGYFDPAADTKPLLHLWSLGIEEQFYIIWPLLLWLLVKNSWHVGWTFFGLALISFCLNIGLIQNNAALVFYSPLTRSWELILGALAASQSIRPNIAITSLIERSKLLISLIGIFLLMLGFYLIDDSSSFPGWYALLPTIGTVFLIASGPHTYINKNLLSNRLLVWIGLISFPLYLWHWPLISFARIIYAELPPLQTRFILIVMSIFLAWLTYEFLEKPIRRYKSSSKIIWGLVITLVLIGISGHLINKSKGVPSRHFDLLNADPASLVLGADRSRLINHCGISGKDIKDFQSCWTDPRGIPRFAVMGNSKGEAIFYGLARESDEQLTWMMLGNMIPIITENSQIKDKHAIKTEIALNALINNPGIEVVVLGVAVRSLFRVPEVYTQEEMMASPHFKTSLLGLDKTITTLEKANKQVVFFMDHPGFPDPKSCIGGGMTGSEFLNNFFQRKINPKCFITYDQFLLNSQRYIDLISELKRLHPRMYVYDPNPLLCDIPKNVCKISKDGKFLYSYGDHLSDYANSMIAKDLLPKISHYLKK